MCTQLKIIERDKKPKIIAWHFCALDMSLGFLITESRLGVCIRGAPQVAMGFNTQIGHP